VANARIPSLEAELKVSRKAWDVTTVAKATAEKSTKSALARAKKAEKALSDANKEHLQREQAVTERLNKMSTLARGEHLFPFLLVYSLLYLMMRLFLCLCFLDCVEHTGVSSSTLQPDDDPLIAAVNLLEANWISVQEIFELACRVLARIFFGLWPKQRVEVPETDLKKLAKAFDTPDDPILLMKGHSVKRGAEGVIALAYAHGEEVNWEKVSSSRGRPLSELRVFFEKAKKYAPGIVSIISPLAASTTSAMPVSSTPAISGSMPPPNAGATSATPTSAMEHDAEVV
jgi:hypothetical protein